MELAHRIGLQVDADTERAHLARRFEHHAGHADLLQRQGRRQPADAAAGDEHGAFRHAFGPIWKRTAFLSFGRCPKQARSGPQLPDDEKPWLVDPKPPRDVDELEVEVDLKPTVPGPVLGRLLDVDGDSAVDTDPDGRPTSSGAAGRRTRNASPSSRSPRRNAGAGTAPPARPPPRPTFGAGAVCCALRRHSAARAGIM